MVPESYSYIDDGKDIFRKLEFKSSKRWRSKPPANCPHCSNEDIQGVEILGAYDGPLFWECPECSERFLRFTERTTIAHLDKTKDLYIDLEGLDRIWEQEPN